MGLDRHALNDGSIKRGQRRGVGTFGQFTFGGGAISRFLIAPVTASRRLGTCRYANIELHGKNWRETLL
jgi:hypothetical protein